MKRDIDLIRQILLKLEELPMTGGWHNIEIGGRAEEEIIYHVRLMAEAGLIEAQDLTTHDGIDWRPKRIAYAGHEFLDAARSDKVWNKAKGKLQQTTGAVTLSGMKAALEAVMSNHPKVFISHASEDKERFVLRFAERLRGSGIDAWLDIWEMLPGDKLVNKIFEGGLRPSDAVIVVLSETSIKKPWVQKELDTAVVKSIEQRTRLIPIRLDKCEIPACLKDGTLYQEIADLEHYDAEFERIVNAIYGQLDKPPLGEPPAYVRPDILQLEGLTPIDSTIFEHACRIAIKQGHAAGIEADQLVADLERQGISEAQIMESQEILEGRNYIKLYRVIGPPHVYGFKITTYGFHQFATVGIANWGQVLASVARILVREVIQNRGQTSKHAIADELQQPKLLVEHIFKVFNSNGWIKYSESIGGDLFMTAFWVSPELRRSLEATA